MCSCSCCCCRRNGYDVWRSAPNMEASSTTANFFLLSLIFKQKQINFISLKCKLQCTLRGQRCELIILEPHWMTKFHLGNFNFCLLNVNLNLSFRTKQNETKQVISNLMLFTCLFAIATLSLQLDNRFLVLIVFFQHGIHRVTILIRFLTIYGPFQCCTLVKNSTHFAGDTFYGLSLSRINKYIYVRHCEK